MGSSTFKLNVVYSQNIQFSAAVIFFLLKLLLPFYIDVFISYTIVSFTLYLPSWKAGFSGRDALCCKVEPVLS